MPASAMEKLIIIVFFGLSIPANALIIAYFFNRRWYRRKKRAFLSRLADWGMIESADKYMKTKNKF